MNYVLFFLLLAAITLVFLPGRFTKRQDGSATRQAGKKAEIPPKVKVHS